MLKIDQSISYILYCLITLCSVFGKDREEGRAGPHKKRQNNIYTQSLSAPPHLKKQCNIQAFHIALNILQLYFSSSKIQQVDSSISLQYRMHRSCLGMRSSGKAERAVESTQWSLVLFHSSQKNCHCTLQRPCHQLNDAFQYGRGKDYKSLSSLRPLFSCG